MSDGEWTGENPGNATPSVSDSNVFKESNTGPTTITAFGGALLFSVGLGFQSDLEQGALSEGFQQAFEDHEISLSENVTITTVEEGTKWRIMDADQGQPYLAIREDETLNIHDDATIGQIIHVLITTGNTTIQAGPNLHLQGGINFSGSVNDVITLLYDGTSWYEVSRSVN